MVRGGSRCISEACSDSWSSLSARGATATTVGAGAATDAGAAGAGSGGGYETASLHEAPGARLAKRVCSRRKASFTTPVGPLRCLATMSSAVPASGLFGSRL